MLSGRSRTLSIFSTLTRPSLFKFNGSKVLTYLHLLPSVKTAIRPPAEKGQSFDSSRWLWSSVVSRLLLRRTVRKAEPRD